MEQLRQASPVARAAGQTLATQTFALLKRNGEKGRTETLVQRGAGPGSSRAQRAPPRPAAAGAGSSAEPLLSSDGKVRASRARCRVAAGAAEVPHSAAALCCPLATDCPAPTGRTPRLTAPRSLPRPPLRGRERRCPSAASFLTVLIPPASDGGRNNIDEHVA